MVSIFIAVNNRHLNLLAALKFTKTQNEPKRAETKQCKSQPAAAIHDPIFPSHVHNQAGFDNLFINGRGFFYLGISKMIFNF